MERELLRKVQLEQLNIAKEIDRICKKNNIKYFLDSGSMLGAVRHKGFIPWDDDLDIGMLREDYEKFNAIAPNELGDDYCWQTWNNDNQYAVPFGKVRKKGTIYLEKRSPVLKENGIFVDILPYDFAPEDPIAWKKLWRKHNEIYQSLLVKSHYKPWIINGKTKLKTRIHFLYYKVLSFFKTRRQFIDDYERITESVNLSKCVYQQTGTKRYDIRWFDSVIYVDFEDTQLPILSCYHDWLSEAYGDYMTPPPESEREDKHEIYIIEF